MSLFYKNNWGLIHPQPADLAFDYLFDIVINCSDIVQDKYHFHYIWLAEI